MRSLVLLAALLVVPTAIHAQGCAQCRDNTAAMPPPTQVGYRRAIVLLVITAGTLFAGTVVLLKRTR